MAYGFFIDTTLCMGCRGCQVACKQWHDLPAENTVNKGTYQNPPDLSFNTYKLVRMREEMIGGNLHWLFFPAQCRHCLEAPCLEFVKDDQAIYRDVFTGAVIFTSKTKDYDKEEIRNVCPYNVPRADENGISAKCDMCADRVHNGELPACVKTCPTGAMNFGELETMKALAKKRLDEVSKKSPDASLIDPDDISVIYLVEYKPEMYAESANGLKPSQDITRKAALRRLVKPIAKNVSGFLTI